MTSPRCGKCNQEMPAIACLNHQHTCSCGAIWIAVDWGKGDGLEWLWIPKKKGRV